MGVAQPLSGRVPTFQAQARSAAGTSPVSSPRSAAQATPAAHASSSRAETVSYAAAASGSVLAASRRANHSRTERAWWSASHATYVVRASSVGSAMISRNDGSSVIGRRSPWSLLVRW